MRQILGYTLMLLRAYRRDWVALFFGFFFPLIFMGLFGILNFGSFGHVSLGIIDQMSFAVTQSAPILTPRREHVQGRNLKYVDFLTPGILGMTIMQLGVAGVMFTFVVDRQRGVIRRIMATPLSRRNYMASHVLMRLVLAVLQVLVLLAVAVIGFKVTIIGSIWAILLITVLGSAR